jgi:hypothetical protein
MAEAPDEADPWVTLSYRRAYELTFVIQSSLKAD